jgi:hypothetical protein
MGLPCVVGASDIRFDARKGGLVAPDGRVFKAGDVIRVVKGGRDEWWTGVFDGTPPMRSCENYPPPHLP